MEVISTARVSYVDRHSSAPSPNTTSTIYLVRHYSHLPPPLKRFLRKKLNIRRLLWNNFGRVPKVEQSRGDQHWNSVEHV